MDRQISTANYIVSFDTFMLQPIRVGNTISTRVIERNGELRIPRKPIHIVRKSCDYYGGSLQNSTNTAKLALKKQHKVPIIVAHDFGKPYIFLPTMSPSSDENIWISSHAIDLITPDEMGSIVHLENNISVKINISDTTMHRQLSLSNSLEKNFFQKQRQLNRPSSFGGFRYLDEE